MKKFISLLKNSFKEDVSKMNFIKSTEGNKHKMLSILKGLFTIFIICSLLVAVGTYAYFLAEPLSQFNQTHVVLSIFSLLVILFIFMDGIYRAGDILFESRDNDMLLSMPINKTTIISTRLIRFLAFEYIFTFLIMVPTIAVYEYFAETNIYFYISTLIFLIILPIIPTIVSCIAGYIIKIISSRFKNKNIVQLILFIILTLGIIFVAISMQSYMNRIVEAAQNINDVLLKLYYPIGLYIESIIEFNLGGIILLLLSNIAIIAVFSYIFSLGYYKAISKLSEKTSKSNYNIKNNEKNKVKGVTYSLFKKELSRYISSPIYIFNTAFGAVMMMLAGAYLVIKAPTSLVIEGQDLSFLLEYLPIGLMLFFGFVFGVSCTTSTSISLEGKAFWVTKSLPIKESKIFISKMLVNMLVVLPVSLIVIFATAMRFEFSALEVCMLVGTVIIMSLFISILGLILNLTWPKFNFQSDVQVVKQSMSAFMGIFIGMLPVIIIVAVAALLKISNFNEYAIICIFSMLVITVVLWIFLNTYGVKRFRKL